MGDQFSGLRTAAVNGAELAYVTEGQGDLVVLVHGGVSDLRTWNHLVPKLGRRWKVIAYSRRYARPNENIPDGMDDPIQTHVDDLAALLRLNGPAPAHLIGHSWGGFIVLMTAIQYPELVRSLVMIEPPVLTLFIDFPPKPRQVLSMLAKAPLAAFAILKLGGSVMGPAAKAFRRGDDKAAVEIFGRGVLGPARFDRLSPERYRQVWDNRKADKAQMLGRGFPPLEAQQVAAVDVPALLLAGSESPAAFRRMSERLRELMPRARLDVVQGASHIVHEDAPDRTSEAIADFLKGQ